MRFKRYFKDDYRDTPRKRAAVLRKQRAECEAFPLFADQIAAVQPDVDSVMERRRLAWTIQTRKDRAYRAMKWRQGRERLRQYPVPVRNQLLAYWNSHVWLPGDPSYFLDMMFMYDNGRLNLDVPGL